MSDPSDLGPAPSSFGVDLRAERTLVTHHDMPMLTRRLHRSLRRRAWVRGAGVGAGATAALALLLWSASPMRDRVPESQDPTIQDANSTSTHAAPNARGALVPPQVQGEATHAERSAAPPARRQPTPARDDAHAPSAVASPRAAPVGHEQPESRLRAQLRIYQRAQSSLAAGDLEGARALLDELDARYPHGALAAEADGLRARLAPPRNDDGADPEAPARLIVGGGGP